METASSGVVLSMRCTCLNAPLLAHGATYTQSQDAGSAGLKDMFVCLVYTRRVTLRRVTLRRVAIRQARMPTSRDASTHAQMLRQANAQAGRQTNGQTDRHRHRHRHRQAPIGKIVGDELQSLPLGPVSPAIDRLLARVQAAAAVRCLSAQREGPRIDAHATL